MKYTLVFNISGVTKTTQIVTGRQTVGRSPNASTWEYSDRMGTYHKQKAAIKGRGDPIGCYTKTQNTGLSLIPLLEVLRTKFTNNYIWQRINKRERIDSWIWWSPKL